MPAFETSEPAFPQGYNSSNKVTPPTVSQIVTPAWDQAFKYMSLLGPFSLTPLSLVCMYVCVYVGGACTFVYVHMEARV